MVGKFFLKSLIPIFNKYIRIFKEIKENENIKYNLKILGSYKSVPFINAKTYTEFTPNTHIGKYCSFNGMVIRGGGRVTIGDHFHSGREILLITSIHNYEGELLPYDDSRIDKDISIGDNVWIGNKVIILGGSEIGEGVIIQAGSVVVGKIPKYAIAGGHPAKPFIYRDKEHYEKLKKEKKFLKV